METRFVHSLTTSFTICCMDVDNYVATLGKEQQTDISDSQRPNYSIYELYIHIILSTTYKIK